MEGFGTDWKLESSRVTPLVDQSRDGIVVMEEDGKVFEANRERLEAENAAKRDEAAKAGEGVDGTELVLIRASSNSGQLYGSVAARDIAEAVTAKSGLSIGRSQVVIHDAFKTIGLFPVTIALHPEVKVEVKVNIARSIEEAAIQKKTGKALIKTNEQDEPMAVQREDGSWLLDGMLEVSGMKEILALTTAEADELEEFQTLGGFVMGTAGRVPDTGDHFEWAGWRFEVIDMDAFATFNEAYVAGFGDHRPARSTVAVRELPAGGQVEIEAIAYKPA